MYKVAIPSYKRAETLRKKTLETLRRGKVPASKIFVFVANEQERKEYERVLPKELYNRIIVGVKGITNQRIFIKDFFNEGEEIVSVDDDVEELLRLSGDDFVKVRNVNKFFEDAFKRLKKEGLFIWGIYPVRNAFFMKNSNKSITTGLKFIIGTLYGFIVRHDKSLEPSKKIESKEDYEQSMLYFMRDGGVLRFNHITVKTKFFAKGGLGEEKGRFEANKKAAEYLQKTYPQYVSIFHRKSGMTEIRLRDGSSKTKKKRHRREKKTRKKLE